MQNFHSLFNLLYFFNVLQVKECLILKREQLQKIIELKFLKILAFTLLPIKNLSMSFNAQLILKESQKMVLQFLTRHLISLMLGFCFLLNIKEYQMEINFLIDQFFNELELLLKSQETEWTSLICKHETFLPQNVAQSIF